MRSIRALVVVLLATTILVAPSTPANAAVYRMRSVAAAESYYTGKYVTWTSGSYFHRATIVRWLQINQRKHGTFYYPVFRYTRKRVCYNECPRNIFTEIWSFATNGGLMPGLAPYSFAKVIGSFYTRVVRPCFRGITSGFMGGVLVARGLPVLAEDGAITGAGVVEAAGGPAGAVGIVMGACVSTLLNS